jgi:hypothetical protein
MMEFLEEGIAAVATEDSEVGLVSFTCNTKIVEWLIII